LTSIGIVGPGRAGVGLGLALHEAGHEVYLHGRRGKAVPPPLSLSVGDTPPWLDAVEVVLLAVRDDAVEPASAQLAASGGVKEHHVVLHLSGILDETPLAPLIPSGAARGTMHPLQALTDPESAPDRLRGALAAITGDPRACYAAKGVAESIGLIPIEIDPAVKVKYHAAAVIASNYLVVLAAVAEQLLRNVGFPEALARGGLTALMRGTLDNVSRAGPAAALTGPIVRGDTETIEKHLAALPSDAAALYRALGRAAAELAGLDEAGRAAIDRAFDA